MIRSLAHACFVVSDLDRSIRFYCDGLGMKLAFEFRNEQDKRTGVYLSCGGRTFIEMFVGQPAALDPQGSYRHISLEVDNLDTVMDQVVRQGGPGSQVTEKKLGKDGSWQAWTADPDGNRIELHQYTADSRQTKALAAQAALEAGKK